MLPSGINAKVRGINWKKGGINTKGRGIKLKIGGINPRNGGNNSRFLAEKIKISRKLRKKLLGTHNFQREKERQGGIK